MTGSNLMVTRRLARRADGGGKFCGSPSASPQRWTSCTKRGLVHDDLKPTHIPVNCAEGQARLIGFGFASRLPRERQAPELPETIAGTLACMAPEQTGRMNRSIASRSELYVFGACIHRMLPLPL
jgi:serine/threonine protein kinase